MRYFLKPQQDKRKTFSNKAEIEETENKAVLFSYLTPVCEIDKKAKTFKLNNKVKSELLFSNTTLRHIREFLYQFGINTDTSKKALMNGAKK